MAEKQSRVFLPADRMIELDHGEKRKMRIAANWIVATVPLQGGTTIVLADGSTMFCASTIDEVHALMDRGGQS